MGDRLAAPAAVSATGLPRGALRRWPCVSQFSAVRGRPVPVRGIIISTGSRRGTAVCSDFLFSVMASPHVKTTVAL